MFLDLASTIAGGLIATIAIWILRPNKRCPIAFDGTERKCRCNNWDHCYKAWQQA